MTHQHSDLGAWIRKLRSPDPSITTKDALDAIDREALDSAVGFAAEHCRRYIATAGADDGWDGPRPILILYTTGRRSGQVRRNPLLFFEQDGRRFLIASNGGAAQSPMWFHNLQADPQVHVRVLGDVYAATARPLAGQERAALWPELVDRYPMFAEYQEGCSREIPVIELVRSED